MHFREQAKKIQLLAYRSYDVSLKRSVVKMIGSLDISTLELTVAHGQELSAAEQIEVAEFIKDETERRRVESMRRVTMHAEYFLVDSVKALDAGFNFTLAGVDGKFKEVWTALIALEKVLEAAGHHRPKRAYGRAEVDQQSAILPGFQSV